MFEHSDEGAADGTPESGPQLTRATPSAASSASDGACSSAAMFTAPRTSDMKRRSGSVSHKAIGYLPDREAFARVLHCPAAWLHDGWGE